MPNTLATIPEIVVGNIVRGDVVLRNVVINPAYTTDSGGGVYTQPIDMVNPWKPPTDGGIRPQPVQPAKQFDTAINPNDFAKLPADTRVIFIDNDEIIDASREEATDFLMNGAYFVGAFAPETAAAVIADMVNNPIPSPDVANSANIADIIRLQMAVGLATMTYFNAYLDADEAWLEFEGMDDDETILLTTPPLPAVDVPKNFPAEREVRISFAPDYRADFKSVADWVMSSIVSKSGSRAVVQQISRHDGKEVGSVPFALFKVWVEDSVTDLQILEGIRSEMNANQNIMISTKRLTGLDVGIKAPVDPVPLIPEENKAVVANKYSTLLNELQNISKMCWTEFNNGTAISRPCEPGESGGLIPQRIVPRVQAMEQQAQVIAQQAGTPAGCLPVSPQTLPPAVVSRECLKPKPPTPKPVPVKLPAKPPKPPGTNSGGMGNPAGLFVDKATGKTYTRDQVLSREGVSLVTDKSQAAAMQSKLEGLPSKYTYLG